MTRPSYSELLKDPRWQKRRLEIMGRDEFMCQMCCSGENTLHVHHRHYIKGRKPWEYEDAELVTLCESCHEAAGEQEDLRKQVFAQLRVDGPRSIGEAVAMVAGWALIGGADEAVVMRAYDEGPAAFNLGVIAAVIDAAFARHLRDLVLEVEPAFYAADPTRLREELLALAARLKQPQPTTGEG